MSATARIWGKMLPPLTITCLLSYRSVEKFKSCWTGCVLSAVRSMVMSNSPQPSSWMRNGGLLTTGFNGYQPRALHMVAKKRRTLRSAIPETRVQAVCHPFEDGGGHLFTSLIEEPDLNRPRSLGEAFHLRRLVSVSDKTESVSNPHVFWPCVLLVVLQL